MICAPTVNSIKNRQDNHVKCTENIIQFNVTLLVYQNNIEDNIICRRIITSKLFFCSHTIFFSVRVFLVFLINVLLLFIRYSKISVSNDHKINGGYILER